MIYTVVSIEFSIFVTKMYYSLIRRTVAIKVVMSTKIQNILYFISFCIEQYKNEIKKLWHLGPVDLYRDLEKEL